MMFRRPNFVGEPGTSSSCPPGSVSAGRKRTAEKQPRGFLRLYLDRLDKYVEQTLIPKYTRGDERARNAEYERLNYKAWHLRKMGRSKEAKALRKQYQQIPSKDTNDPNFRRLHYVRYADDWLLGFTGPIAEAQNIKEELRIFLKDAL